MRAEPGAEFFWLRLRHKAFRACEGAFGRSTFGIDVLSRALPERSTSTLSEERIGESVSGVRKSGVFVLMSFGFDGPRSFRLVLLLDASVGCMNDGNLRGSCGIGTGLTRPEG